MKFYDFHTKELGRGAYGVVYKARQVGQHDAPFRAIKKIPKKFISKPAALQNEISILRSLDHPCVIKLYETFEERDNLYLVTDLCEGGDLYDRLEEIGSFSEDDARKIFKQVIEAISYCHSHKISHRDLKP